MRDEENVELEEEIETIDDDSDNESMEDLEDGTEETINPTKSLNIKINNQNIPNANINNSSLSSRQNTSNKSNPSNGNVTQNADIPKKTPNPSIKKGGGITFPNNMLGSKIQKNASMDKLLKRNPLSNTNFNSKIGKDRNQTQTGSNIESNDEQGLGNDKNPKANNIESKENNSKNNNQNLKSKVSSAKDDAETATKAAANIAAGNKLAGAIDIAKLARKHIRKIIKKYLIAFFASLFIIIIIFFMIMSPLIENLEKVKEFLGQTVEFGEKTSNLYSGFGFKTTDEAFFDELSYQYGQANGDVDLPLVMSALMYTETTNDYSTDYSVEKLDKNDTKISSTFEDIKSKSESEYTQGQILRARMLCKAMTGDVEGERVTLSEFVANYNSLISANNDRVFDGLVGYLLSMDIAGLAKFYNFVTGQDNSTAKENLRAALSDLLTNITNGARSLSSIDVEWFEDGKIAQIYVTMITKKYSEDNFKSFLSSYYIKKMPEFKPIIEGLSGIALDNEIDRIIKEIYDHRSWYKDIYGNIENSSENYENTCIGAISKELIPELTLPVKINSSSVTFIGEYAYGITTGQIHNGIDLNSETTGTNDGDDVFAISIGEVTKVGKTTCNKETDESCDANGTYIKLKHSTMIDGATYDFYSIYANLQANSVTLVEGDRVEKGAIIGKAGKTGDATIAQVHFEFHNEDDTPIDPTNLFIQCSTGTLSGNSNEEKIWFYFRNLGYSEVATAAAMGNLSVESGLEPQRVQGTSPGSQESIDYTNDVDSGKISRNDFVKNGPGGGGYGLAQWTSSGRKDNLYSYKKKENTSIGDLQMQLGYLMTEIDGSGWTSSSYKNTWKNASQSSELNSSTTAFCNGFERPGVPHLDAREKNARNIYDRNKGKTAPSTSNVPSSSNKILTSAKKIKEYIASHGYTYSREHAKKVPSYSISVVDCSSFVSWVLYEAGYSQFRGSQASSSAFLSNSWGFKEVSKSDVQPGDILVYDGHVEIYVGMNGNKIKVYNAGSNYSIRKPGITESGKSLGSIKKILRP